MKRYKSISKKIDESTSQSTKLAQTIINDINKMFGKSILRIELKEDKSEIIADKISGKDTLYMGLTFAFLYKMNPNDPFIDTSSYSNRTAIIYPAKKAFQLINNILTKKYKFKKVNYNNTGNVFWVTKIINN